MKSESQIEILILGGKGMLGHKLFQRLRPRFPGTWCTLRGPIDDPATRGLELFSSGQVLECCDAADFPALEKMLLEWRPGVVINCVGVIKQRTAAKLAVPSIILNALLPHRLAELCGRWGGKLIHFSTDCVFDGRRGGYEETDLTNAEDLYGRTKALGEVSAANALTLRTSIIGRELDHFQSLLEWLLGQNQKQVRGYTRAFYSGVTTNFMAKVAGDLIERHPQVSGLYQVTSAKISKFNLLCLLRDAYGLDIDVVPDDELFCDRSMKGEKFAAATGYICPEWSELVAQLASDDTPYAKWRSPQYEML